MEKERLLKLADHLEGCEHVEEVAYDGSPFFVFQNQVIEKFDRFSMSLFLTCDEVGMCGCIAGHAHTLIGLPVEDTVDDFIHRILWFYGLTDEIAVNLFHPSNISMEDITPHQAAQAVRNVVDGAETENGIWKHV